MENVMLIRMERTQAIYVIEFCYDIGKDSCIVHCTCD